MTGTAPRAAVTGADPHRPPVALLPTLLVTAAVAWLGAAALAAPMGRGVLTQPATGMTGGMADPGMAGPMSAMEFAPFVAAWAVMMAAMMLPSLAPAVRSGSGGSWRAAAGFVTGYLLVWTAAGAPAYLLLRAVEQGPAGGAAVRVAAAVLLVAALYQISPVKRRALRRGRAGHRAGPPRADRAERPRTDGGAAAPLAGLRHGGSCLASSWPLMVALLLFGMMNLALMAAVAGLVAAEKLLPRGPAVAVATGVALAALAVPLLVTGAPVAGLPVVAGVRW
jgi:predicted metal-binding membrane protein